MDLISTSRLHVDHTHTSRLRLDQALKEFTCNLQHEYWDHIFISQAKAKSEKQKVNFILYEETLVLLL